MQLIKARLTIVESSSGTPQEIEIEETAVTRSRVEADREDMMAEAANLLERLELQIPDVANPVTIGRNRLGHWSFYWGAEPMARFDSEGGLRRAVRQGKLYRTQGSTLAELVRVRLEEETQLQRRDLNPEEAIGILEQIQRELRSVSEALNTGSAKTLRVVCGPEFDGELRAFLNQLTRTTITLAEALPTKRT